MHRHATCHTSKMAVSLLILLSCSALTTGLQTARLPTMSGGSLHELTKPYPSSLPTPSVYFYYLTSGIRILVLYDPTTGAHSYANDWSLFLISYGYETTVLPIQVAIGNSSLMRNYNLVLLDSSCGGTNGKEITLQEAESLVEIAQPLILLGASHGVIDRMSNFTQAMGRVAITGIIQKASDRSDHSVFTFPYRVIEAGFGPPHSIEIFSQAVSVESYPENTIDHLYSFGIVVGATESVVGALYSSCGSNGRVFWWAFQDPSTLNENGKHLFANTVEWMGGYTDLELVHDFLNGVESLNASKSEYWTGGFGDYFEPEISATYYACESLKLVGRLDVINTSALTDWLVGYCYSFTDGAFLSHRGCSSQSSEPTVTETGMALLTLSSFGALGKINVTKTSEYLQSCQLGDGFVRFRGDTSRDVTNTYWALQGLNATGSLNTINRTRAVDYLLSCQNQNQWDTANYGGFSTAPAGISFATSTYMALTSLKLLGALNSANRIIAEEWLMNGYVPSKGTFYDEHIFHKRNLVNDGTGYSIASLYVLGKTQNIDQRLVANYLKTVQFKDGGWSKANCTDEAVDEVRDCYPVILGLQLLGHTNMIRDIGGFIEFLNRCLSPEPKYGFSNIPRTLSNLWQTTNAISTLYNLGLLDSAEATHLFNSIIYSYSDVSACFEWLRINYPPSSDGYSSFIVEEPFEYSFIQRGRTGVILTDLATTSLLNLDRNNWISSHALQIWNEISQCEVTTGPYCGYYKIFSSAPENNLTAGLRCTYHALNCMRNLAAFLNFTNEFTSHLTNTTLTVQRIMSLYDPSSGSFNEDSYMIEPYSPAEATFMSLASLKLLNALSHVDYEKTTAFLQSSLFSNLVDSYYSFKGLQALNELSIINKTSLVEFVKSFEKPDGAFEDNDKVNYRLDTTRMSIEILSDCNYTWVAAKQLKTAIHSVSAPSEMQQGLCYAANFTMTDDKFLSPLTGATARIKLGTHAYSCFETPVSSGKYASNISVPFENSLLGSQCVTFRCSKERYQTSLTQLTVTISNNRTLIDLVMTTPVEACYLTTSNTSVSASIHALNASRTPIIGASLRLYVNSSLSETASSNSSGQLTFAWKPYSSAAYCFSIIFDGSRTLSPANSTKAIYVSKTATRLTISSNHVALDPICVGSILQLGAQLSEITSSRAVANSSITFVVLGPSEKQTTLLSTTRLNGSASAQFTVNENGNYSIYCEFQTTEYYSGSTSEVLLVGATPGSTSNDGDNNDGAGESWVTSILDAVFSPLGFGLLIGSGCLMSATYVLRARQRELDSLNNRDSQSTKRGDTAANSKRRFHRRG